MGYGRIVSEADNFDYPITSDDVLWTARMLTREGGNHAATLWTMTQRAVQVDIAKPGSRYPSFTSYVRAYSQPINPKWAEGGQFCPTPDDNWCSPARLAVRASVSSRPWSEISPEIRALVTQWAEGKLPNPVPGAVHFRADDETAAAQLRAGTHILKLRAGNVYTAMPETQHWTADRVRIVAGRPGWLWALGGGALAGMAYLGYSWLSKR